MMQTEKAAKLTRDRHFFRFWMPYLFQKVDVDGVKWAFLPLNRNYKPLGIIGAKHVDYRDFALSGGVRFGRNPASLNGIWTNISGDGSQLWLYADDPKTRIDYFDRLETLMSLSLPVLSVELR